MMTTAYEVFKWLKSENCSNLESKRLATKTRKALGLSSKEYRKMLSKERKQEKVLERTMSDNRFEDIEFDKIPSKAGLNYKNAFERNPATAEKYKNFVANKNTKVNANTLYPYEIVAKAKANYDIWSGEEEKKLSATDRQMIEKYWDSLPDYFNGKECKMLCVVDTSGSMSWGAGAVAPINVAISLGMYCAERINGPFKNHFISFSDYPQLIKIEGVDFVDKVRRIYDTNLCSSTNLVGTFEMIREIVINSNSNSCPTDIIVLSDMEINEGTGNYQDWNIDPLTSFQNCGTLLTEMEQEKKRWEESGLTMPRLVYWNLAARQDNVLDFGPGVSYVSGFSPVLFKQILTGVTGEELMLQILNSKRYAEIVF